MTTSTRSARPAPRNHRSPPDRKGNTPCPPKPAPRQRFVDATEGDTETGATEDPADDEDDAATDEPDTFPREVVEKLRQENGKHRQRAQRADTYAERLHTELVRATGRPADPSDLEFAEDHLDNPDAMRPRSTNYLPVSRTWPAAGRPVTSDKGNGAQHPNRSACCRCSRELT
jgi:hypothetical protein